jgi:ATP-binding protein involved in chromosome partitioning
MVNQESVLDALRVVIDPDLHRDIVSLGFVKDLKVHDNRVSFALQLTTPACPVKDQLKQQAEDAVKALGADAVEINMTFDVRPHAGMTGSAMLAGVKNVVPVASGKGGVGKSTVSANLAVALSKTGAKVGLLDADVYGPSIPTILGITDTPKPSQHGIQPVMAYGVRVISAGFFIRPDQAVVWRGPMLAKMIEQFLSQVDWGELDYLIVDLPPGTGDVQLTLCQRIPLTGAVIVTTPQPVAVNIAEKAIIMFHQLKTPVLGVIENMSYHVCRKCGSRHEIFAHGGGERLAQSLGVPFLGELPLVRELREGGDYARPLVAVRPDHPVAAQFRSIAERVMEGLERTEA